MWRRKIVVLLVLQLIVFLGLVVRLFELQIINGEHNRVLAEENRVRREILPAGRGRIFDRRGLPLVENIPLYYATDDSCRLLDREEALAMQAENEGAVRTAIGRRYLYGSVLAHYLGYVGQVNASEVDYWLHLESGDLVGRGGVEESFDTVLRGEKGWEIFEVDAFGEKIRVVGQQLPRPGRDLQLAVDVQLSQAAFEALGDHVGAVVVTEAGTGRVLAMVSSPSFEPDVMSLGEDQAQCHAFLTDPAQPFFNRGLGGTYPPGSTFKLVTAIAGLEEGKIDRTTTVEDTGVLTVGEYEYGNWYFSQYGRTEGVLTVTDALKRSNDIYFYKLGEWLGPQSLADWARRLGMGQATGINLPGEAEGLVPDPDWKRRVKGERWYLGNTYQYAIGQSDLLASPLQVNVMTAVVANDGWYCRPILTLDEKPDCHSLELEPETVRLVREGMEKACASGGTATTLFDLVPSVACKTGTAQFHAESELTHGWLTAYAPADQPEIVVTAVIEASKKGSSDAMPVVKRVVQKWYELENQGTVLD